MSLLTLIQRVTARIHVAKPTAVIGNTDENIRVLIDLANQEGESLLARGWESVTRESTHTTLAAELQGAMTTIAGPDFDHIIDQTIWNRTRTLPISGGIGAQKFQQFKAFPLSGQYPMYRIRGGDLLILPVPVAGETLAFEWVSKNFCKSSGGTGQTEWLADTDTGILSEPLMVMGVKWRWLADHGLDYAQSFTDYERAVNTALGRDGGNPVLDMNGGSVHRPGINVPQMSWPL